MEYIEPFIIIILFIVCLTHVKNILSRKQLKIQKKLESVVYIIEEDYDDSAAIWF